MSESLVSIGELSARTSVAPSALRYYEELGLIHPAQRKAGSRRYAPAAVEQVGAVRLLQEVGFTLREIRRLMRSRSSTRTWKRLAEHKLEELDERLLKVEAAREALRHSLACPQEHVLQCPTFRAIVREVLEGKSLRDAHHGDADT